MALARRLAGLAGAVLRLRRLPGTGHRRRLHRIAIGGGVGQLLRSSGRSERAGAGGRGSDSHGDRGQARWLEQRTSLARELHDVVGHHVTAMVVQAEAGQVGDPQSALREIGDLGSDGAGRARRAGRPPPRPRAELTVTAPPRLSDIDELLAAPLRRQGVDVTVRVDPDAGLDEVGVLTVYRIAQEALTNVARHAQATARLVELRRFDDQVRLRITDDGIGPPVEPDARLGPAGHRGAGGRTWRSLVSWSTGSAAARSSTYSCRSTP